MTPSFRRALLIAAGISMSTTAPSRAADLDGDALAFVNALAQGRFVEAGQRFDATMAAAMPTPVLAQTWQKVQSQVGAFQNTLGARREALGAHTAVLVRSRFAQATLDVKLVFDGSGKIAGLFFVPAQGPDTAAAEVWSLPAYADAARFREVDVVVGSAWPLPGKLTLPLGLVAAGGPVGGGKAPALVLVHGSGPQDLDETLGPSKPFKDLAVGLASRGVAVLRYDKRTRVHGARLAREVTGFTLDDETVNDAVLAVELLAGRPEVDPARIFVLGHSLGGTAAPRIAARSGKVAGLVVLAGGTRPLGDTVVDQLTTIALLDGKIDEAEARQIEQAKAFRAAAAAPDLRPDATLDLLGARLPGSYLLDLRAYHPAELAATLAVPMLVLQGGRDYQVTRADFAVWQRALGGKKNATLRLLEALDHRFVAGTGPSRPADYGHLGHVDAAVIEAIARFVAHP